jgi:hypothetical protein
VLLEFVILHAVAGAITLFGILLMWRHQSQWNRQQVDEQIEVGERRFLHSQYRRRMQSSAMIAALGCMLHASNEHLIAWQKMPVGFFVYICVMLVLVAWIVMLAFADFLASQIVHQTALSRLHEQRQQLEQAVTELRRKRE